MNEITSSASIPENVDHVSQLPYALGPNAALALIVALDPPPLVKYAALCADLSFCIYVLTSGITTGKVSEDYVLGLGIAMHAFTAIHFLLLTRPLDEFRHERDTLPARRMPLWQKIYWSLCSVQGIRAVGWNVQVANVPARSRLSKWAFVYESIKRAANFYLLTDACETYITWNPLFQKVGSAAQSITSQGALMRCFNIVAMIGTESCRMSMQYLLLASVLVATGLSYPQDWPDVFGSYSHAYTVRQFWGKTWHQMCRRHLTSMSRFFVNLLGFKKGTTGSSYTQLYTSFILSGLIHACGDAMVGKEYFGSTFLFFPLQAVVITIEDIVIALFRKLGFREGGLWAKFLGYAWVSVWFFYSTPLFVDWSLKAGMNKGGSLPFSIVQVIYNFTAHSGILRWRHL